MSASLRCLRAGRDGHGVGTILTVDFGQSRGEAGFDELALLLETASSVHDCVAPGLRGTNVTAPRPSDVLARWRDEIDVLDMPVTAILGYCAGGPVARALAGSIDPGEPPPVVMLDTEPVDRTLLLREFRRAIDGVAPLLDDGERDRALAAVQRFAVDETRDVGASALAMSAEYAELSTVALERAGIGGDLGAELRQRVDAWLRYVAVAAQCEDVGSTVPAVLVTSRDWAAADGRLHRRSVDVSRANLLRDSATAAAVSELIGG